MRDSVAFSGKVGGVQSSRFSGGRDTMEDFIVRGGGHCSMSNFQSQVFCWRRGTLEYFQSEVNGLKRQRGFKIALP